MTQKCILGLLLSAFALQGHTAERRNALLILVDDLKPALGCYGDPLAKTPNIDRLAARGMRFDMAYCNQAVCAPSRNNLLLGTRSTSLGIYSLGQNFRQAAPDAVTMPQYFMKHGWRTEAIGKILHTGHGNHDDEVSWSVPSVHEKVVEYLIPANSANGQLTREEAFWDEEREVGVAVARRLEHAVQPALHVLPQLVAVGRQHHGAAHGRGLRQLGGTDNVLVPLRVVLVSGGDALGHGGRGERKVCGGVMLRRGNSRRGVTPRA